jgi:hypothetical protein
MLGDMFVFVKSCCGLVTQRGPSCLLPRELQHMGYLFVAMGEKLEIHWGNREIKVQVQMVMEGDARTAWRIGFVYKNSAVVELTFVESSRVA